jgi:hypothetical protein
LTEGKRQLRRFHVKTSLFVWQSHKNDHI